MGAVGKSSNSIPKNANVEDLTEEQIRGNFRRAILTAMKDVSRADFLSNRDKALEGVRQLAGKLGWGFSDKDLVNLGNVMKNSELHEQELRAGVIELLSDSNFHTEARLLDEGEDKFLREYNPNGNIARIRREAYKPYFDYIREESERPRF